MNTLFTREPLVPVLGLCPLLVITTNVVNATIMGVIYMLALVLIGTVISMVRNFISPELRVTVILMIAATLVTVIHLVMQAFFMN